MPTTPWADAQPLVSIVTPTFPGRERELFDRCIPSVAGQEWPNIEHVIVSDRNPELAAKLYGQDQAQDGYRLRFAEINESWRNPTTEASIGAIPWMIGTLMAMGEFIGFLGDDDELMPDHVTEHVTAMTAAAAHWSVSRIDFHVAGQPWTTIGDDSYELGHLDATGTMCHRDALRVANWTANGENAADYRLVRDWRRAGLVGTFIDETTGIHHDGWAAGKTGRPDRPQ